MKTVTLVPKEPSRIPLEAENISPNVFAGKTLKQIEDLPVFQGNKKLKMGECFRVAGETSTVPTEQEIHIEGSARTVKWIGANMTAGSIVVHGDAGMHLGSGMTGGEINVRGSVADWAGAEMKGGTIQVKEDAGNFLGAAYRGSSEGMDNGLIIVKGSAGDEVGANMRRGVIVVLGDVGGFTGVHMIAGTIMTFGRLGRRAGAQMWRGSIITYGGAEELLPSFKYDLTYSPFYLNLYLKKLYTEFGIEEAREFYKSRYDRYHGDLAGPRGLGEILIFKEKGG